MDMLEIKQQLLMEQTGEFEDKELQNKIAQIKQINNIDQASSVGPNDNNLFNEL